MRITVHISEEISKEIKRTAQKEKKSISSLLAEAAEYYLKEKRRKKLGQNVLGLAGKVKISADAIRQLEEGRKEYDRP